MPETYVGKCKFCKLGEEAKRGVIVIEKKYDASVMKASSLHSKWHGKEIPEYKCGLGEEGKECIVPQMYSMIVEAANRGDPRFDTIV